MSDITGNIYIGTSGWHYKHWKGNFYPANMPQRDYLNHYLQFFKTVEINNSFYKLPAADTFACWRKAVPEDFIFAVKGSRFITHMKKLKDPEQSFAKFIHQVGFLEEKLGPILFQLPPMWNLNYQRLKIFLEMLPAYYRYTIEFRNANWYDERVYELLREHKVAFCIYELEGHMSPMEVTADFVYVRLHGPEGKYAGSYSDTALQWWANQALTWSLQGKHVYIYFDNDQNGYAVFNAQTLKTIVSESR